MTQVLLANSVGELVKQYREAKNLSRSALAEMSGVTYMCVYYVETGRRIPKEHTIKALARGLGIPPAILVS